MFKQGIIWTKEDLGGTELVFDHTAHAQQSGTVTSHTRKQSDTDRWWNRDMDSKRKQLIEPPCPGCLATVALAC